MSELTPPRATSSSDPWPARVAPLASRATSPGTPADLPTPPPTGTVTFLLTEIEGSTTHWDEAAPAMAEAVALHHEILDLAVARYGGVRPVEQGEGEGMMVAVFSRASDAVAAAVEAQRVLTEQDWPAGAELAVRMAVHTGEAELRDEAYYVGPSIIRTARLRSLAHGGQIVLSGTAADLVADLLPPDAGLLPLGTHPLTGLRTPERVLQLTHPQLRSRFPPPTSGSARTTGLPVHLSRFVGRADELAELGQLSTRHRLVTLTGAPGCGKTRLALRLAEDLLGEFPDGIWWVDLAAITEPATVPFAVLNAVNLEAQGLDPIQRLTGYLRERRALLVLDNCEHLAEAVARILESTLVGCPEVAALATSREPLGIGGEMARRVEPLSLPSSDAPLEAILEAEAVQLFADRAAVARPGFRCDAATAPTVAAICARLDGIPLAIELAASRLRAFTTEGLLAALTDRFAILTGGARTAAPRQQTLAASVAWGHDLLDEAERTLLRRLSVFVGSFDQDAVAGVTPDPALPGNAVLPALARLVEKSMVTFDGERYRLLQTIRDFAADRLTDADEVAATRTAHLTHYRAVAAAAGADLEAGPQLHTLDRLELARENLHTALDWALACDRGEDALRLAGDLALFWHLHGRHMESLTCLSGVLASTPTTPTPARARALWAAGQLGLFGMDMPVLGTVDTASAVEMATAIASDDILGRALGIKGYVEVFMAPAAARESLATAHAVAARANDRYGMTAATTYMAMALVWACDRPDLAEPHLARLAAEAKSTGSPYWSCWHGLIAGIAAWRQGRLAEAARLLADAEELGWAIGEPVLESWCARWLADVHSEAGDFAAAEGVVARSAAWMDRSSFARLEIVLSRGVQPALARAELAEARRRFGAVEDVMLHHGIPFLMAEGGLLAGRLALADADLAAACDACATAEAAAATVGTPWYLAQVANLTGWIARAEGSAAAAEDAHHRALTICLAHSFAGLAAETFDCLASLAVAGESWAEAARLYGVADGLRRATGHRRFPLDDPRVASDADAIGVALGPAKAAEARAEGAALSLEDAGGYASRARGERKRPSSGWDSLTPTELKVTELVAAGLTNADIGARLFITTGTVKTHVHTIFGKLGISRRSELAARATERRFDNG